MYAATLLSSLITKHKSDNEVMKNTLLYTNPHIPASGCWVHPEMSIANYVVPGVHPLSYKFCKSLPMPGWESGFYIDS